MPVPQSASLIAALLDPETDISLQDDAAMDLGEYDEPEAEAALLKRLDDPSVHEVVAASCGESLAEIWCRRGSLDREVFATLRDPARHGAEDIIRLHHPEWLMDAPQD